MHYDKMRIVKLKKVLFASLITLILTAAIAIGNADVTGSENVDPQIQAIESQGGKNIQSIAFKKNMEVTDALMFLALKYDKNIIPSPSVGGTLAFTSLFDVTFEEAMDAILGEHFRYEQRGNLIKVYTRDEYKKIMEDKDRMITKIFRLYYISAEEVIRLLTPVLSGVGEVRGSTPPDTVVPTGESVSTGSAGGDSMALNDAVVIKDYPEKIAEAEKLLRELDVRPQQVLVEATILSATLNENTQLGIDWATLSGVVTQVPVTAAAAAGDITKITDDYFRSAGTSAVTKTGGVTVGFSHSNIGAILKAVEEVSDTTILANPKILAVNKQLGVVYIGTKIGYQSQTTQTDTSTTQEVSFLETGTRLAFRPYIGNDGYIRMDINPKDSSGTLKTNNIPDETSTELSTNIMVRDGQTIVIGGLFRDVVTTSRTQIPLLGDLPLIGFLFRGVSDLTSRQEVIVMLTPHIIKEPDDTGSEKAVADVSNKQDGVRKGLQWIGRRRLAEDRYTKAVKYYKAGESDKAQSQLDTVLHLRPTYLEALELQARITNEKGLKEQTKD